MCSSLSLQILYCVSQLFHVAVVSSKITCESWSLDKTAGIRAKSFMFWLLFNVSEVQCWFKLTGQNALNLKFKTRFSQIGLSLGENLWRQD